MKDEKKIIMLGGTKQELKKLELVGGYVRNVSTKDMTDAQIINLIDDLCIQYSHVLLGSNDPRLKNELLEEIENEFAIVKIADYVKEVYKDKIKNNIVGKSPTWDFDYKELEYWRATEYLFYIRKDGEIQQFSPGSRSIYEDFSNGENPVVNELKKLADSKKFYSEATAMKAFRQTLKKGKKKRVKQQRDFISEFYGYGLGDRPDIFQSLSVAVEAAGICFKSVYGPECVGYFQDVMRHPEKYYDARNASGGNFSYCRTPKCAFAYYLIEELGLI